MGANIVSRAQLRLPLVLMPAFSHSLASTVFHMFVASDSSSETFASLKRIHGLMPYFVLKATLKISNPIAMIRCGLFCNAKKLQLILTRISSRAGFVSCSAVWGSKSPSAVRIEIMIILRYS